jgi:hypothetical protein
MEDKIRNLSFREGEGKKDDLKTEIGRLSIRIGVPKDKMVDFIKVAGKDLQNRVAGRIQKIIDTAGQISFKNYLELGRGQG